MCIVSPLSPSFPTPLTLMARCSSSSSLIISYCLILLNLYAIVSSNSDFNNRHHPMILPLHLSTPNLSAHRMPFDDHYSRRHLQNSELPKARMRLFDDLLSNGYTHCIFFFALFLVYYCTIEFSLLVIFFAVIIQRGFLLGRLLRNLLLLWIRAVL